MSCSERADGATLWKQNSIYRREEEEYLTPSKIVQMYLEVLPVTPVPPPRYF